MAKSRRYLSPGAPGAASASGASSVGNQLLPSMGMGGPMGMMGDPETTGPGKSARTQHLGSVIGKRGAGISQIGGGDQMAHAVGHYKKGGITGMTGGGQGGGLF